MRTERELLDKIEILESDKEGWKKYPIDEPYEQGVIDGIKYAMGEKSIK